ncbi:MAG: YgfZ/GcvT domain-containing protein [Planctomycetaceae bacterium]
MLPGRATLFVRGADAVRFVDNFTTAALARLGAGTGTEGFFTDARGHVLALVNILRTDDGLWLDGAAGIADPLRAHLDHHLIREQVELLDATADLVTLLLAGPHAPEWLAARCPGTPGAGPLAHARVGVGGVGCDVVALDWFGPGGLLLQAARGDADRLTAWLRAEGLPELDAAAVAAARIEAGTPEPADVDPRTLPQELGRDARAISFTKGCYLGQETVARLDALGHVNRRLVVLATAVPPAIGAAVTAAGETVGRVTSACVSPRLGGGLGLALVHVRGLGGAALGIDGMPARVVPPPAGEAGST